MPRLLEKPRATLSEQALALWMQAKSFAVIALSERRVEEARMWARHARSDWDWFLTNKRMEAPRA